MIHLRTTRRTELVHVTDEVARIVAASECKSGVCHLYVPHTTAAVIVNEGYDPDVHAEGNSDSHIKTAMCGSSETIWIENGQLALGRWQVIFFFEFDGPRRRELRVKIVPDAPA
ncbi:MAG: YjbQ family protein [Candidatus Acidiferrales bacterium]